MIVRYVLDTDHLTLLQHAQPELIRRISQVKTDEIGLTVISIEESVRGWLSEVRDASRGGQSQARKLHIAYDNLRDVVQFLSRFQAVSFTESASTQFADLRRQGVRIGTQDLRIASICLVNGLILLTRNAKDFSQVPNLAIEDWTI